MSNVHITTIGVERTIGPIKWYRATCTCSWHSPMHGTTAYVERWATTHREIHNMRDFDDLPSMWESADFTGGQTDE